MSVHFLSCESYGRNLIVAPCDVCKRSPVKSAVKMLLMRESYYPDRKRLLMVPRNVKIQVLRLAHASSTVGHFGKSRMVDGLRTRLD